VFITGLVAIMYLPIPITLAGGLRTDWIQVSSGDGSGQVIITTKAGGGPMVVLYDGAGNGILSISAGPLGGPEIELSSADGDPLVTINNINRPTIRVYDPDSGEIVWETVGEGVGQDVAPPP